MWIHSLFFVLLFFLQAEIYGQTELSRLSRTALARRVEELIVEDPAFKDFSKTIYKSLLLIQSKEAKNKQQVLFKQSPVLKYKVDDVTVEFLPKSKNAVIHLPKNRFFIGAGMQKDVVKVLFVQRSSVVRAAHCFGTSAALKKEGGLLLRLKKNPCVVRCFASVDQKKKGQISLYLEYCNGGTFRGLARQWNGIKFVEKVQILRDVVVGLSALHGIGYVHYDLHGENIFLSYDQSGRLRGRLADLGRAYPTKDIGASVSEMGNTRIYSPEALVVSKYSLNRYKTDIYALGKLFYLVFSQNGPPWNGLFNNRAFRTYPRAFREDRYKQVALAYNRLRKQDTDKIEQKAKNGLYLSAEERFKLLTYRLLHYEASKRPSLHQIKSELDAILALPRSSEKGLDSAAP